MPTDSYMDEYYDSIYHAKNKRKNEVKRNLVDKFSKMSLEEKMNFLVNEYIKKQVSNQG